MPARVLLKFLGTSSAPNATRNYSSLLVKIDQHTVMVDCGESTQRQLINRAMGGDEKLSHIRTILVTHLHTDHVLGIVPLMMTMMGPSAAAGGSQGPRLEIYGPSGLRALIRSTLTFCYAQLNGSYVVHELLWPSQRAYGHDGPAVPTGAADKATGTNAAIVEEKDSSMLAAVQGSARVLPHLPPHESELPGRDFHMDEASVSWPRFAQAGGFHISAAPILHRCPTIGYVFEEPAQASPLPSHVMNLLDENGPALLEQRGIRNPRSLLARLLKDRQAISLPDGNVLEPPPLDIQGRKLAILGDTFDGTGGLEGADQGMASLARGADVLVHECTNAALPAELSQSRKTESRDEVRAKALLRGHSTPQVAGAFAGKIGASALLLNHFSVRYPAPPHWALRNGLVGQPAPRIHEREREDDADEGQNSSSARHEDGASSARSAARTMSEPERRMAVIRNIEDQATEAWLSNSTPQPGSAESAVNSNKRAIAAFDGFTFEVLSQAEAEKMRKRELSGEYQQFDGERFNGENFNRARGSGFRGRGAPGNGGGGRGQQRRGQQRGRGRGPRRSGPDTEHSHSNGVHGPLNGAS